MSGQLSTKKSTKLEAALKFTKLSIFLLRCWPPSRNASSNKKFIFDLSWWFLFVSSLLLLFPLMASVYTYRDNPEIMTKSICLSCAVSQCTVKTFFCRLRRPKLQKLLEEMESFIKNPSTDERRVLEKYVSQCSILHVGVGVWTYITSITFIIGPFFMDQPFPTNAVSAAVLLDSLVATLLWFLCARFELLEMAIDKLNNSIELRLQIIKYQNLLRYTKDVKNTINLFVFSTILTSVGGVLFSAFQLVTDQPITIKAQFAVVAITALLGLFMCSWAADNLLQLGYRVGVKAFHSNWLDLEIKSKTCLMHVISLSQLPITVKANSILPALSLAFFSQFLMMSFKFFTAIRIMIG